MAETSLDYTPLWRHEGLVVISCYIFPLGLLWCMHSWYTLVSILHRQLCTITRTGRHTRILKDRCSKSDNEICVIQT